MSAELRARLTRHVGDVRELVPVGGGDISHAFRVETAKGEIFFLKANSADKQNMFEREAEGLRLLREHTSFRIPKVKEVLTLGPQSGLLMEWVESSRPDSTSWGLFWKFLGEMHSQGASQYGFEHDNFIGSLEQKNSFDENWIEFWIEHRISPLVAQAMDRSQIVQKDLVLFLKLFDLVRKTLGEYEFRPGLLHGDLWHGNLIFDANGTPTLIDPAVYYGWPEMELAFMNLFGGIDPTGHENYRSKDNANFLGDNYYPLWQIYPLLVHAVLFGGTYARRALVSVQTCLEIL